MILSLTNLYQDHWNFLLKEGGCGYIKFKMGNVVEANPLMLEHNKEDAAKDHLDHEASLN